MKKSSPLIVEKVIGEVPPTTDEQADKAGRVVLRNSRSREEQAEFMKALGLNP